MASTRSALLLDEDVWPGLATALHERGYDAVSVHELQRTGQADEAQFVFAIAEGRAILTHNAADFVTLAVQHYRRATPFPGIIIAPHLRKSELLQRTLALLEIVSPETLANTVRFV